jgi:hypothetical protein
LGILVDCKHYQAKIRRAGFSSPPVYLAAPVVPPAAAPARALSGSGSWAFPVVALVLGLLFFLSVTAGALHARLTSAREPAFAEAAMPPAPAASPKAKPAAKTPPRKEPAPKAALTPAPAPMPAPTPGIENAAVSVQKAPLAPDDAGSPAKVEEVKIESVAAKEPIQKLVKDVEQDAALCSTAAPKGSGDFCGTAVTFLPSPKLAAEEALKQHKLLFVLHVSGNFEDPGFT